MEQHELSNIQQIELSLTRAPAIKEGFLMKKSDDNEPTPDPDPTPTPDPKPADPPAPPEFSFDSLSEEQRAALAAVAQILGGDTNKLDENTKVFVEAAKSIKTKTADPVEVAKSVLGEDGIKAIQAPIVAQLEEVSKRVELMQGEREFETMKEVAKSFPGAGDEEATNKLATQLIVIRKAMDDTQWGEYVTAQQAIKAQVENSTLFNQISSSAPMQTGNAETRLMAAANEIVSKSVGQTDLATAIGQVASQNPALYREYQGEIRAKSTLKAPAN